MQIQNLKLFQEDGSFTDGTLCIDGTKIATDSTDTDILDGENCFAIPGLTDIHFHGCSGFDLCDASLEGLQTIASYELRQGVTQICPASMSLPESILTKVMKTARIFQEETTTHSSADQSDFVGIHLEGPFLAPAKCGAQDPRNLCNPDLSMLQRLQETSGNLIRIVDVAPEREGALDFIRAIKDHVTVSIAHTTADYETSRKAMAAGVSHITHMYNAMPPLSHREPGVIGAAFDTPDCRAELICDGVHIAPAAVRAAFQLFGDDRIILISDSMRATGLSDGDYELGGQAVTVKGPRATLGDGTLAGSVTNLMDCLRQAVKSMGIPLGTAVKCAAVNPAKAIGIYENYGSLTPGKMANIVLLDQELNIRRIIFHGKQVI